MSGEYINPYALESLYKVTKKKVAIEQLVNTYFIHLEKTIVELSEDRSNDSLAKLCHRIREVLEIRVLRLSQKSFKV